MKITEGLDKSTAINVDSANEDSNDSDDDSKENPVLDAKQAYDVFNFMVQTGADNCAVCDEELGTEEFEGAGHPIAGYMISCLKVLCRDCFKDLELSTKGSSGRKTACDICTESHVISYVALERKKIQQDEDIRSKSKGTKKVLSTYKGPHTKTKRLIQDLMQNSRDSMPLIARGEMRIKSVVFTSWTSHMDLIGMALTANDIAYTRLDGTMTRVARSNAMEIFQTDPKIHVILVSIAAGGVGLNLTAGSKVYVSIFLFL